MMGGQLLSRRARTFLALGLCCSLTLACHRERANATLLDYRGLDGCTWVIASEAEVYEVINLDAFISDPEDGMSLAITYSPVDIFIGSICMAGPFIELHSCEVIP